MEDEVFKSTGVIFPLECGDGTHYTVFISAIPQPAAYHFGWYDAVWLYGFGAGMLRGPQHTVLMPAYGARDFGDFMRRWISSRDEHIDRNAWTHYAAFYTFGLLMDTEIVTPSYPLQPGGPEIIPFERVYRRPGAITRVINIGNALRKDSYAHQTSSG